MKGKQRISKIAEALLLNDERFNHCDSVAYGVWLSNKCY
jgi:hypothetical protein